MFDIIIQIAFDIKYFMLIMFMCIFALATSFHYIGKNQLDFDEITQENDRKKITYHTYSGALWYIGDLMFGNYDRTMY